MNSPKVIVIGWDGATFNLIERWRNELPNIWRFIEQGSSGRLLSTIPPVTASAWISFMTGTNPGKHGVFDFIEIDVKDYESSQKIVLGSNTVRGNTFLDVASHFGSKVGAIGIPMTYPVWNINGFMIAGLPGPDILRGYAYPKKLEPLARQLNFKSSYFRLPLYNKRKYVELSYKMIERRAEAAIKLNEKNFYDLLVVIDEAPDRVQHLFWKYMEPETFNVTLKEIERYRNVILNHYKKLDLMLKKYTENFDKDTTFIIISDHGFRAFPIKYFNTNFLLKCMGLLYEEKRKTSPIDVFLQTLLKQYRKFPIAHFKLKEWLPSRFRRKMSRLSRNLGNIRWEITKAYRIPLAYPAEGIAINLKGRQRLGIVDMKEYEELRQSILDKLKSLKDPESGSPIVEKAWRREEIYEGPYVEKAPDIVFVLNRDYKGEAGLDSLISAIPPSYRCHWNGLHDLDGILVLYGPPFKNGIKLKGATIQDIAPTILYLLGHPIPSWMDGKVLKESFKKTFIRTHEIRYTDKFQYKIYDEFITLEEEEERQMKERLQGLGYIP